MFWGLLLFIAGQFDTTFREGLVALNQNQLAIARTKLEDAAKLEPGDARVWLALAETYFKLGQPDNALKAATRAQAGAADPVVRRALETFYFHAAEADLQRENFAGALTTLTDARKQFDTAQLALASGVALYGLRRFPEAIDAFLRTVELDADAEQPYIFLGRMLDEAEDRLPRITAAFAAFQKRAPESYLANFLLGKAQGSAALVRKSIAENDAFADSHFALGVLLARDRQYEEAAREFARAAQLKPDDAATHYHLARVYDRLGKPAEAEAERAAHARLTTAAPGMGAGVR